MTEVLGLELEFAADELAPPVEADRIRALLRQELSRDEEREILSLILGFRTWHEALQRAVREQLSD